MISKSVDGVEGDMNIAKMWKDKCLFYNRSIDNVKIQQRVTRNLLTCNNDICTGEEITEAEFKVNFDKLRVGKAVGLDGISSKMLKLQTKLILFHLNILFNAILALGITPHKVLHVKLVSISKNRF